MVNYYDVNEPTRIKELLRARGWIEKPLKIGDFIAGDFIIERTTYNDLLQKLDEKRYKTQVMNLKNNIPDNMTAAWIIEGNMKKAFMSRYGTKWGFDKRRRSRILGAITSILAKHKFILIPSVDQLTTVEMLTSLGEKTETESWFDLVDTIESPVHGLGSSKFSELISWFSIWARVPFTHLSNIEITRMCTLILKDSNKEKLKGMKGIGRGTIEKVKKYYGKL